MNVIKIQCDILRELKKRYKKTYYIEKTDSVVLVGDGYRIFVIRNEDFYLDVKKITEEGMLRINGLRPILEGSEKAKLARRSTRESNQYSYTLCEIKNDECSYWVKKAFLDPFDYPDYKISPDSNKVYVYEGDVVVSIVLPVRVSEDFEC